MDKGVHPAITEDAHGRSTYDSAAEPEVAGRSWEQNAGKVHFTPKGSGNDLLSPAPLGGDAPR